MCGGYGRDLITLAQHLGDSHASSSADDASGQTLLSLGREGVGEIVALGDAAWSDVAAPGERPWRVGSRVWFSPRIVGNQGALAEYAAVTSYEMSVAPMVLSDIEASTYPFAISTAWTALVD